MRKKYARLSIPMDARGAVLTFRGARVTITPRTRSASLLERYAGRHYHIVVTVTPRDGATTVQCWHNNIVLAVPLAKGERA